MGVDRSSNPPGRMNPDLSGLASELDRDFGVELELAVAVAVGCVFEVMLDRAWEVLRVGVEGGGLDREAGFDREVSRCDGVCFD